MNRIREKENLAIDKNIQLFSEQVGKQKFNTEYEHFVNSSPGKSPYYMFMLLS